MNARNEALHNAVTSPSMANYGAIFSGFISKGLSEADIRPRENVFTFNAWAALGRQVKKGEHGVQVCTWVPMSKRDDAGESQPIGRHPRMTTVFHVSQTEPRAGYSEGLWQYALNHPADAGIPEPDYTAMRSAVQPEPKPYPATDWAGTPNPATEYYSNQFTPL